MEHVIKNLQQNMDDADLMTDSFYKSQDLIAAIHKIVPQTNINGRTPSYCIESLFLAHWFPPPAPQVAEIDVDYFSPNPRTCAPHIGYPLLRVAEEAASPLCSAPRITGP